MAASAALAFTADRAVGAATRVTIPRGTAVASTPPAGKQPVTFETVEEIEARPAWNALCPQVRRRQEPGTAGSYPAAMLVDWIRVW